MITARAVGAANSRAWSRVAARPSTSQLVLSLRPKARQRPLTEWQTGLACPQRARSQLLFHTSSAKGKAKQEDLPVRDPSLFDQLETRTFSIIAHIDHGKSTLADRLLEHTGTIPRDAANQQVLDKLKVERERGITVKSQAVSMVYDYPGPDSEDNEEVVGPRPEKGRYLLNLIDTPGHVDFAYEVSRSLSACQSALLVVDATQGIQAQSISVYQIAKSRGLLVIPVLNKIDLPASDPERVLAQLGSVLGLDINAPGQSPLMISAKTGQGVDAVLRALVERTEPPEGVEGGSVAKREDRDLRALVFDSWYDQYKGVVALVSIMDGAVRKGDKIASAHSRKRYEVLELGVNSPGPLPTGVLRKGQVGWIVCNMKDMKEATIGDTLHLAGEKVEPLEGFKPTMPMVYAGIFPLETTDFLKLEDAINRLALNDRSVTVQRESSVALGQGCRLGFLGTLHLDVFRQRLEDEYGHAILVTAPTVPYRVIRKDGSEQTISTPVDFPEEADRKAKIEDIQEPVVRANLIVPEEYTGEMMELCAEHRGEQLSLAFLEGGARRVHMVYRLPLAEVVTDFFDKLKSRSSGFASFDYEEDGWESSDLVKLSFLIAGAQVDALALILHRSKALAQARAWTKRLREVVPRQQFEVAIQATVGAKIVARESISAYRKDVTAGLYGGHYERKLKHLNKQKEGKKRLREVGLGRVRVPQSAFMEVLDSRPKSKS